MRPMKFGFGQRLTRVEDDRLLRGHGRYTSDLKAEGALEAFAVRSPHAAARFAIRDVEAARAMPGVHAILTHADVASLGPLPVRGLIEQESGEPIDIQPNPVLPKDEVRHVGEAVAFVVADTLEQARDAAEAIEIEWEPRDAVAIGLHAATADGAPLVWPELAGNVAFVGVLGDEAKTEAAFAEADRVVSLTVENNRLVANYLEPRACLAEVDANGHMTLTLGSQGVHGLRDMLARSIFKVPPETVRVVTPDVGGGFGTKTFMYREYPLALVASKLTGRPVSWTQDRTEHFLSCAQGRDNVTLAEMALDARGRFLAMRVDLKADMGAYLSQFAPYIPYVGSTMTTGVYDIPAAFIRITGVYTNTVPVDAYRGAGRPEAAYLVERLVDECAVALGETPDRIRARNFIKPKSFPYTTPTGRVYDSGEFEAHMRLAMERIDWKGFRQRERASVKAGHARGIGLAVYIEACGGGGAETAVVRIDADGGATVLIGTQSNGQGHATAYAQLASQHLDLPLDRVRVVQGDTSFIATGSGTGGSRSIPVGGASVSRASETLVGQLKTLAAEVLETGVGDLEVADGGVRVVGTDRAVGFDVLATRPGIDPSLLAASDAWKPPEATYPNGTHACEVEIDPLTGVVTLKDYVIVDDFGVTLNPLLLEGQVHGGIAQGIGQALLERTVYGEDGQLLTASFMDYALPRADDLVPFRFETRNVPCVTNVLGVKGAGEAGSIGACPAVMNAVNDALRRLGVREALDMPATPERVWQALQTRAADAA